MANIHTLEPAQMRSLLLKVKSIVDSNGRPVDVIEELQSLLNNDTPLRYDPYPFPEEKPNPRQLRLI